MKLLLELKLLLLNFVVNSKKYVHTIMEILIIMGQSIIMEFRLANWCFWGLCLRKYKHGLPDNSLICNNLIKTNIEIVSNL